MTYDDLKCCVAGCIKSGILDTDCEVSIYDDDRMSMVTLDIRCPIGKSCGCKVYYAAQITFACFMDNDKIVSNFTKFVLENGFGREVE